MTNAGGVTLAVGSLFAGIGGLDLGLERAGMEVLWQVEKDEYCRRVLAKHWPDVVRYEDVRDVGADELEDVDLIAGGFPCQDISVAGKGEGIEGERSGLWSQMWRCIREIRPRYALVENVPALRFRGLGRVLGDLAEIRYDAEWDCVPASAIGAPHVRDRIFIVAYPQSDRRGEGWSGRPSGGSQRIHREAVADTNGGDEAEEPRVFGGPHAGPAREARSWLPEPDVDRVVDGFSAGVDRRRALGNAVVPQVAEYIGRRIVEAHEGVL